MCLQNEIPMVSPWIQGTVDAGIKLYYSHVRVPYCLLVYSATVPRHICNDFHLYYILQQIMGVRYRELHTSEIHYMIVTSSQ